MKRQMELFSLALHSLQLYWREQIAMVLVVATAIAILVGGLGLGDSVNHSLRDRALRRLGGIESVIATDVPFRQELGEGDGGIHGSACGTYEPPIGGRLVTPILTMRATLETDAVRNGNGDNADGGESEAEKNGVEEMSRGRMAGVTLVGCRAEFFRFFGSSGDVKFPGRESSGNGAMGEGKEAGTAAWDGGVVALGDSVARRLDVAPGDSMLLRIPSRSAIPTDSVLGRRDETLRSVRVTVTPMPCDAASDFSLQPDQRMSETMAVFVPLEWLADRCGIPGRANGLLRGAVVGDDHADVTDGEVNTGDGKWQVRPTLADLGLRVDASRIGDFLITSDQMFISPRQRAAIELSEFTEAVGLNHTGVDDGVRLELLLWLANSISPGDGAPKIGGKSVPYSAVAAVSGWGNAADSMLRLRDVSGALIPEPAAGEMVLNAWTAEQLGAVVGDSVTLEFFTPEYTITSGGEEPVTERSTFRVVAVAAMDEVATDPGWTPVVQGLTDARSLRNWDAPFPFDATRIRPEDEAYWDRYRMAPKAWIGGTDGQRLWGSRFGTATTIRIVPSHGVGEKFYAADGTPLSDDFERALAGRWSEAVAERFFTPQPVREEAIAAASGNTPFGVLFIMCSFFLLGSAVILIALVERLSMERRAREIGLLYALGWDRRRVMRLFLIEGTFVAGIASLPGIVAGIMYTKSLAYGLCHGWVAAMGEPFVRSSIGWTSMVVGATGGIGVAVVVIAWVVRRMAAVPPARLLVGDVLCVSDRPDMLPGGGRRPAWIGVGCGGLAVSTMVAAAAVPLTMRPGLFFVAGILALVAMECGLLWAMRRGVRGGGSGIHRSPVMMRSMRGLVLLGIARQPGRSLAVVTLVASSMFLVTAMGVFRMRPTATSDRTDGVWETWVARTDAALAFDPSTTAGRASLGFSAAEERILTATGVEISAMRSWGDTDASCRNLYRVRRPQMIGVPAALTRNRSGFGEAALAAVGGETVDINIIDEAVTIPMAADQNTAMYALHLWGGVGSVFEFPDGERTIRLRLAAMVTDAAFPGAVLVAEDELLRLRPDTNGYDAFIVDMPASMDRDEVIRVSAILADVFGDAGWRMQRLAEVQAEQMSIRNTYLAIFQMLGAMGVLLGIPGIAAIQWRSVQERRRELGLLRAIGFSDQRIGRMLLAETGLLLMVGIGIGAVAAMVVTLPHMFSTDGVAPSWMIVALPGVMLLIGGISAWFAARTAMKISVTASLRSP